MARIVKLLLIVLAVTWGQMLQLPKSEDHTIGSMDRLRGAKKKPHHTGTVTKVKLLRTADYLVGAITISVPNKQSLKTRPYKLIFDTGSSRTWVFSDEAAHLMHPDDKMKHHFKTPGSKITASHYPDAFRADYKNGARYVGNMTVDSFEIGGVSSTGAMGLVNDIQSQHSIWEGGTEFDGYFGLSLNQNQDMDPTLRSPFYNMMEERMFSHSIFSAYFSPDGKNGEFIFGGMDTNKFTSSLQSVPLSSDKGDWIIALHEIRLGSMPMFSHEQAVIDTGSQKIFMPVGGMDVLYTTLVGEVRHTHDYITRYNTEVGRSRLFIECDKRNEFLVPIEFVAKGRGNSQFVFSLDGEEYFPKVSIKGEEVCMCIIEESPLDRAWTLGLPLLRKYYSVFDAEKKEIKFAISKTARS